MQLHHQRGAAAFEAFDERELPQRTFAVERGHAAPACVLEHVGDTAGRGRCDPAEMEVEVEGVIVDPARIRKPHGCVDDLLAKSRKGPGGAINAVDQQVDIGPVIQQHHAHNRGAKQRIFFHVPGECIRVVHVLAVMFGHNRSPPDRTRSSCDRGGDRPRAELPE